MTRRPRLPTLDEADRKVIGIGLVVALAWVLACMVVGLGLGLGVATFKLLAGA